MKETTVKSTMSKNMSVNETPMPPSMVPLYGMPKSQIALIVLLIVASFMMGSLYTKVQYLEHGVAAPVAAGTNNAGTQPAAPAAKYTSFDEAMKAMGKIAKLDTDKLAKCISSGEKKSTVDADIAEGNTVGVNGTPAFFINGILIPGAVPLEEFKKIIDAELAGTTDKTTKRTTVSVGNAVTEGTKGAPITIVEYSDFQCPYCERAYPTVNQVMKDYNGKILLAFKHFPLISIHPHAEKAAEAAVCARDQGKFWEFHNALFENQADWVNT
jgi:protein-disulfide isomerase